MVRALKVVSPAENGSMWWDSTLEVSGAVIHTGAFAVSPVPIGLVPNSERMANCFFALPSAVVGPRGSVGIQIDRESIDSSPYIDIDMIYHHMVEPWDQRPTGFQLGANSLSVSFAPPLSV